MNNIISKTIRYWDNRSEAAKSAVVYTIAILLSRGVSIISTPIFTRIMPSDQIGIVGLFVSYLGMISSITSLALNSGGFMVGLKEFSKNRDQYISSVVTLTTITSALVLIAFLIAPDFLSNQLGLPIGLLFLLWFACLVTPAYEFWLMRQRYEYSYKKGALVTLLTSIISTLLAVLAVVLLKDIPNHLAEVRLYVATGFSSVVYLVIWILLLRRGCCFCNKFYWSFSLSLSIPLLGHSFASQVLNVSDRLFIGKYVDNSAVGIYATLFSIASLVSMLWGALNSSYIPYLFQNIDNGDSRCHVRKNTSLLIGGFSIMAIGASLLSPEIVKILAPSEYLNDINIVPPIISGVLCVAIGNIYSNLLVYYKKTILIMLSTIVACLFSVSLNIFLIPKYGIVAAAYNSLFSNMVFAVLQVLFAIYVYKSRVNGSFIYNNFYMLLIMIVSLILILMCQFLYNLIIVRYAITLFVLFFAIYFVFKKERFTSFK